MDIVLWIIARVAILCVVIRSALAWLAPRTHGD
jgi:hypothetical protein